ncbi:MAG: glycosyltransferase [Planctomycetales bacterium]|nr:glycosyltransferase [Planctomycetales bacterium]MBN8627499.1 glycosyltransferase [Planctomycetota bacterium]
MTPVALIDREESQAAESSVAASSAPRRVLHLINGEHFAGAERVQDLLAGALPEFGFEAVFAALKPDQFPQRRRNRQARLYETPMSGKFDFSVSRAIAEIAHREKCDLIHAHTVRTAMIGRRAALSTNLPMIYHLHSPTAGDTTHRVRNFINAFIERRSIGRIHAAIAVSNSLAEYGRRIGIRDDMLHVVHNGVPVSPKLAERATPCGTWTIGCTALFRPRKGIEILLAALAELRKAGIDARLRAVGRFETPDYERTIHGLAARLGVEEAVEWRGFRSDVAAELAAMDVFVLPSLFGEGLPMVVLEAMSHGVPVIGTRVEGVPEAIRDNVDGLLAAPGDAVSLAEQIQRLISGEADWQALRASAYRRQIEHFSDHSMAAATAEVYRRVIADANRRGSPSHTSTARA